MQSTHVVTGPPAAEEVVDRPSGREVDRQSHPLHAVVDQVAHSVEHLAVAVRLRTPARFRSQVGTGIAERTSAHSAFVKSLAPRPLSQNDRTEPVHVAVTPRGARSGRTRRDTAQLISQRASLVVLVL